MIEILSTLVIVGILASMAAPRFEKAFWNIRFRSANKDIVSSLRLARSMALSDKRQYGVYFDYNANAVTIFRDSVNLADLTFDSPGDSVIRSDTIPNDVAYFSTDLNTSVVAFAPNGTADFDGGSAGGANINSHGYFDEHMYCYDIEVKRATGRIHSEQHNCLGED
jgi:Tfp pilus assembly protein FimT